MATERVLVAREEIRGNFSEVAEVPIPKNIAMFKRGIEGAWFISFPCRVIGGIIEFRLYGPSRSSLMRARDSGRALALLSSIMQETYSTGHPRMVVILHFAPDQVATHQLAIHRRTREFSQQEDTVAYEEAPGPSAKGGIEIKTI